MMFLHVVNEVVTDLIKGGVFKPGKNANYYINSIGCLIANYDEMEKLLLYRLVLKQRTECQ